MNEMSQPKALHPQAGSAGRGVPAGARSRTPDAVAPTVDDPRLAIDDALDELLDSLLGLCTARRAFLAVLRADSDWRPQLLRQMRPSEAAHLAQGRLRGLMLEAVATGRPQLADRAGRALPDPDPRRPATPAWLVLPLHQGMRCSAVLCMERAARAAALGALDLEIAQALTDQLGTALAARRTHDSLCRLHGELLRLPAAHRG